MAASPRSRIVGLDRLVATETGVLHASHRVHGVHQRNAVTALQLQADLTGQPVVGVNQIMVVKARLKRSAELLCQGWQRLFGDVVLRVRP